MRRDAFTLLSFLSSGTVQTNVLPLGWMWFTRTDEANYSIRPQDTAYCTSGQRNTDRASSRNGPQCFESASCSLSHIIILSGHSQRLTAQVPVSVLDSFFSTARGLASNMSCPWSKRVFLPRSRNAKLDRKWQPLPL